MLTRRLRAGKGGEGQRGAGEGAAEPRRVAHAFAGPEYRTWVKVFQYETGPYRKKI